MKKPVGNRRVFKLLPNFIFSVPMLKRLKTTGKWRFESFEHGFFNHNKKMKMRSGACYIYISCYIYLTVYIFILKIIKTNLILERHTQKAQNHRYFKF